MVIDFDTARAAFEASTDFTVGLEEEFALLDPHDLGLTNRFEQMHAAAAADPVLAESIAGELIASEIEIRSGRGEDLGGGDRWPSATAGGGCSRWPTSRASRSAPPAPIRGRTTGSRRSSRPSTTAGSRRGSSTSRGATTRSRCTSTWASAGADRAVLVCDRLRAVLPLLLAVSANSPFLDGRDSGLHSARSQIFTKSFPRCGIPDAFGSWDAFASYVDFLCARTRSSSTRRCGGRSARTSRSGRSRCGSATPRSPPVSRRRWPR